MVEILHRVGIKSSVYQVYQALATPAGVAGWWTRDAHGAAEVGGRLRVRFHADGREIGAFDLKLLELLPAQRVLWHVIEGPPEWIGTEIRFQLEQQGEHAIVLFKHEGWKEAGDFMHHCSTKWALFLMSLKSLLETGTGAPSPRDVKIDNWN